MISGTISSSAPSLAQAPADRFSSCAGAWANFWVAFYTEAASVADGWYRVETTEPCAVARAAGLTVACDAAHAGAVVLASAPPDAPSSPAADASTARHRHGRVNRKNKDGFTLSYADIEQRYGGPELAEQMRTLARRFGYDLDHQD